MNPTLWFSFVATVLLLALTPGPSVLLATANSINYGSKKTIGTILGDLSANLLQILLAAVGLASIIIASGELFFMIKWLGVGYLIYIGLKKIFSNPAQANFTNNSQDKSFKSLYLEGFLVSASNPKAIIFFAALFPLFVDPKLAFWPQIAGLAFTFLLIDGMSLWLYASFASRLKNYLQNQQKVHLQNKIIGSLLVFSGLMLSMVQRSNK